MEHRIAALIAPAVGSPGPFVFIQNDRCPVASAVFGVEGGGVEEILGGVRGDHLHGMAGLQMIQSGGNTYNPLAIDVGGGVDYKLFFKKFSWRVQGDYVRTRYLSDQQSDYRGSTGLVWRF